MELRQKGISEAVIGATLAESADEETLALEAARKHARRLEGLDWPEFRAKLAGHLSRRGFSYEVIASATKVLWRERRSEQTSDITYEDKP